MAISDFTTSADDSISKPHAAALDWAYEMAVAGAPDLESSGAMADRFLGSEGSLAHKVERLVSEQSELTRSLGCVTVAGSLDNLVPLPSGKPPELNLVIFVWLRMVIAITLMGDPDIRSERVKALVLACLAGGSLSWPRSATRPTEHAFVYRVAKDRQFGLTGTARLKGKKVNLDSISCASGEPLDQACLRVAIDSMRRPSLSVGDALTSFVIPGPFGWNLGRWMDTRGIGYAAKSFFVGVV